jgi:hypothetical protein
MGHDLVVREEDFAAGYFARPNGIMVDAATGLLHGGVNSHRLAWAMGH